MIRALSVLLLSLASCSSPDPVDFTTYSLGDVSLDEASDVVRDVTRDFAGSHRVLWDGETRNLEVEPVYDGQRRLKLHAHVLPNETGDGTDVELLALVEFLRVGDLSVEWGDVKKDVFLEQLLHQAYVDEIVERRTGAGAE